MSTFSAKGINIKSYNLGENDKIIVIYTKEHGIIRAVAKGVKKQTSKLAGRMELLIANQLLIAKGKSLDIVSQAQSIEIFKNLRKDFDKLTYSIYIGEVVLNFGLEKDPNSSLIYELLFNSLKNVSLATSENEVLWAINSFLLKFMKIEGYALELKNCTKCKEEDNFDNLYICYDSGGVVCSKCKHTAPQKIQVTKNLLKLMDDMSKFEFIDENLYTELLSLCFNILKDYVSSKSHKKFKTPLLLDNLCY
ncbi:MAG: DNA repair protein RecO [bacterium]